MTDRMDPMDWLKTNQERFINAYSALFTLIETVPPGLHTVSGACGDWSVQQVLQHLSGWLVESERRYRLYDSGDYTPIQYDFDPFNATSVNSRAGQSWEETLHELHTTYQTFLDHAERVTPEQAGAARGYAGWLHALGEDCEEHTAQVQEFLTSRSAPNASAES